MGFRYYGRGANVNDRRTREVHEGIKGGSIYVFAVVTFSLQPPQQQLQLVLALSVKGQSQAGGVSKTNPHINVLEVFTAHVLPEIQVQQQEQRSSRWSYDTTVYSCSFFKR